MPKSVVGFSTNSAPNPRPSAGIRRKHPQARATLSHAHVTAVHSDAGRVSLLGNGGYLVDRQKRLALVAEGSLNAGGILSVFEPEQLDRHGTSIVSSGDATRFVKACPAEGCDSAREGL